MSTTTESTSLRQSWAQRRKDFKPQAVSIAESDLTSTRLLTPEEELPLVIEPRMPGVDLPEWARENADFIEKALLKNGGVLFRGFDVRGQEGFQSFLRSYPLELMHYIEGATPRTQLTDKVYTSTEFPANETIALHNELCYVNTWPMKILFFCAQAPPVGGETPIADVRKVYQLIDPEVRQRFFDKGGWMLMRNFSERVGLPWQVSYRTEDKATVERYFRENGIGCEWLSDNRLRTRQVRPVAERHPVTREWCWFTHVSFWHVSSLDPTVREVMLRDLHEDGLPYATYYGDGTPIEDSVIAHVREAFGKATVAFPWQEGDLLLLDNMLTAHGRRPFEGPRKILTAMGQACRRDQVQ